LQEGLTFVLQEVPRGATLVAVTDFWQSLDQQRTKYRGVDEGAELKVAVFVRMDLLLYVVSDIDFHSTDPSMRTAWILVSPALGAAANKALPPPGCFQQYCRCWFYLP
jgi:hypothetical protein